MSGMDTTLPPARAPRPTKARRATRDDREFLPAALEILETPPSPIKIGLIVMICAFVAVSIGWAYVSRIDIIAVAQGKMQPTGRVKVIQPLDTSRVLAIKVENGGTVQAGEVLVELDPAEAAADAAGFAANLASYSAEVLRRRASIAAVRAHTLKEPLTIVWPASIPSAIRQREAHVYTADLLELDAQVSSLKAQAEQKQAEHERLRTMIIAQGVLIGTMKERVEMRQALMGTNAASKSGLIDALETLQTQQATLVQENGQLAEANADIAAAARDIDRAIDTFIADNAQKLAEAERQVGDLTERLAKAQDRLDHMTLRAPIAGTVQGSTLTTVGQVVTSGQDLMRIVPEGAALEVECYLPNKDIGFVKVGDHAILKIESFPFTRYGTIDATVTRVAHDAIPEPDAEQTERDSTRAMPALSQSGGERTQNLVFPVTLRPRTPTIDVDGTKIPLGAGMAVTAEIRTGSRRILEYVFSPLVKIGSEAMRER